MAAVQDVVVRVDLQVVNDSAFAKAQAGATELEKTLENLRNKKFSLVDEASAGRDIAKMKELKAALAETDAMLDKLGAKKTRLINEQGATSDAQALARIKEQLQATEAQIDKMGAKKTRIMSDQAAQADLKNIRQITNEIQNTEKEVKKLTQTTSYFGRVLKEAQGTFTALIGFAAIQRASQGFLDLGKNIVQAATEIESLESRFTVLLKSSTKAQKLIKDATDLALVSPFTQSTVLEGAGTLLASGIKASALLGTLKDIAEVSGSSETTFQRLVVNVAQVNALGKLQGGEIRQFAQNLVPLSAALEKQFGKTSAEIQKMAEKGQISAAAFNKALKSISAEGGLFEGAMEKAAQTVEGKYSTLKDRIALTFQQIGNAFLPAIGEFLNAAIAFLKGITPEKVQAFVNAIMTLAGWIVTLGKGLLYLGTIWVAQKVLLASYSGALTILTTAQWAYNAALVAAGVRTAVQTTALAGLATMQARATVATVASSVANITSAQTTAIWTAAKVATTASTVGLTAATTVNTAATTASAGAVGLLRGALALLFGPIGLLVAAFTSIVYGLNALNKAMDESIAKTDEMQSKFSAGVEALKNDFNSLVDTAKDFKLTDIGAAVRKQFEALGIKDQAAVVKNTAKSVKDELLKAQAEYDAIAQRQIKGGIKTTKFNFLGIPIEIKEEAAEIKQVTQDEFDNYAQLLANNRNALLLKQRQQEELLKQERATVLEIVKTRATTGLVTAATGTFGVATAASAVGLVTDPAAELEKIRLAKEKNAQDIKDLKILNDKATVQGFLLRVTKDANEATGKAFVFNRLRREALLADVKAIEENIRAMQRQTREFLQQQIDLEEAQAGRITRMSELERKFNAERIKLSDDANERVRVSEQKLGEDFIRIGAHIADAAKTGKNDTTEQAEARVDAVKLALNKSSALEQIAAVKRIGLRKDAEHLLLQLIREFDNEKLRIQDKFAQDSLEILIRNIENEKLQLMQASLAAIEEAKRAGRELNKTRNEIDLERSQRAEPISRADEEVTLRALKQQGQLRLDELNAQAIKENVTQQALDKISINRTQALYEKELEMTRIAQLGGDEFERGAAEALYAQKLKLADNNESELINKMQGFAQKRIQLNLQTLTEITNQEIAFGERFMALGKQRSEQAAINRKSELARQALFPGLREDVRGFGTTGRGLELRGQIETNKAEITKLERRKNELENNMGPRTQGEEADILLLSQKIDKINQLNEALEQTFGDERAERRRANFMKIADGVLQISNEVTSGLRRMYAAQIALADKSAEHQKKVIERTRDSLIAAQTAGNAARSRLDAEQLQHEQERLDKIHQIHDDAVRKEQALAVVELVASSTVAIAKAIAASAATGGLTAAISVAAILVALGTGLAAAKAQASAALSGFKEGGYTGDGSANNTAGIVHGREFVFTADKTAQNREAFEAIHSGKLNLGERLAKANIVDKLSGAAFIRPDAAAIIAGGDASKKLGEYNMQLIHEVRSLRTALESQNPVKISQVMDITGLRQEIELRQKNDARRKKM